MERFEEGKLYFLNSSGKNFTKTVRVRKLLHFYNKPYAVIEYTKHDVMHFKVVLITSIPGTELFEFKQCYCYAIAKYEEIS